MIEDDKFIIKSRIEKRNAIQINIPTFKSYDVTRATIKSLFLQKEIDFDILLIDNTSDDYEKLSQEFPLINFILLSENLASAGAHRIGAELAIENGYEYVIFTDNDALLLDNEGIVKMKNRFKENENIVAVVPRYVEWFGCDDRDDFFIKTWSFHYLFVKTEIFKKIDLHNLRIFLYSDDLALTLKLSNVGKITVAGDVAYYHYRWNPKSLENFYSYFYLRGLLVIIFKEQYISIIQKLYCLLLFSYRLILISFHAFIFVDLSYLKTACLAVKGFFNLENNYVSRISQNKNYFKECNMGRLNMNKKAFVNILSNRFRLFFLPKNIYFYSPYFKKSIYFLRKKRRTE
jgi:GT2 family glycosyltransferase